MARFNAALLLRGHFIGREDAPALAVVQVMSAAQLRGSDQAAARHIFLHSK
jgi:hypothetical protein